jgi:hypothetical protein
MIEPILAALARGRRVIEEMSGGGTSIRDVRCILIPGEEVVFPLWPERLGEITACSKVVQRPG